MLARAISLVAVLVFLLAGGRAEAQCTYWNSGPALNAGHNGRIEAFASFNWSGTPDLFAGGTFSTIGGVSCSNIAERIGSQWVPLGSGTNGIVTSMVVWNNLLVVGGMFTQAGGLNGTAYVAAWDGTQWLSIGGGAAVFYGPCLGLTVLGSDLVVVGQNSAGTSGYAAHWNGSTWGRYAGTFDGVVRACDVLNGSLYVGGSFASVVQNGITVIVQGAARLDTSLGTTPWAQVGGLYGPFGQVYTLTNDGTNLYAGGLFDSTSGAPNLHAVGKFNGSTWTNMDLGLGTSGESPLPLVQQLAFFNGTLFATGQFQHDGHGGTLSNFAKWTGSAWTAVLGQDLVGGYGFALGVHQSQLYVGGAFTFADTVRGYGIARWTGAEYQAVIPGFDGDVNGYCIWDPDGSGSGLPYIVAVGNFTHSPGAGTQTRVAIAQYGTWTTPAATGPNAAARCVTSWDADGNGAGLPVLVIGGDFTTAGATSIPHVARLTPGIVPAWTAMGAGLDNTVYALADYNGQLIAGGAFLNSGATGVSKIARWTGAAWTALGTGGANGNVVGLFVDGTDLYACGYFTMIGGVAATGIAKWNGTTWSSLGTGMTSGFGVTSITKFRGAIIASGPFTEMGGVATSRVARFSGGVWAALGDGVSGFGANSMDVLQDTLVLGGQFTTAGSVTANNVALWNGGAWSALDGGGVNGIVRAVQANDFSVYVGGVMTKAGGDTNLRSALWVSERPAIISQPQDTTICSGGNGSLVMNMSWPTGNSPTLQWYRNSTAVTNGALFSGATSRVLNIMNATGFASGIFSCAVTNSCGTTSTNGVLVTVITCCAADFNRSGGLTTQDIFDFLTAWFAGSATADFNHVGGLNAQDIFDFLAAWFAGC